MLILKGIHGLRVRLLARNFVTLMFEKNLKADLQKKQWKLRWIGNWTRIQSWKWHLLLWNSKKLSRACQTCSKAIWRPRVRNEEKIFVEKASTEANLGCQNTIFDRRPRETFFFRKKIEKKSQRCLRSRECVVDVEARRRNNSMCSLWSCLSFHSIATCGGGCKSMGWNAQTTRTPRITDICNRHL